MEVPSFLFLLLVNSFLALVGIGSEGKFREYSKSSTGSKRRNPAGANKTVDRGSRYPVVMVLPSARGVTVPWLLGIDPILHNIQLLQGGSVLRRPKICIGKSLNGKQRGRFETR